MESHCLIVFCPQHNKRPPHQLTFHQMLDIACLHTFNHDVTIKWRVKHLPNYDITITWRQKVHMESHMSKIWRKVNWVKARTLFFIRPSSDGTYYGMVMSVRPSVRPGLRPSVRPSVTVFRTFLLHALRYWAEIFVYHFIMMHVRASSNAINFRQFLMELCPFLTPNCYKYAVFRTFLLHALTFWAEILHMTLFYCTTEQVRVSSISVNFCWSYAPFGT